LRRFEGMTNADALILCQAVGRRSSPFLVEFPKYRGHCVDIVGANQGLTEAD
jgi:hypothetical protein